MWRHFTLSIEQAKKLHSCNVFYVDSLLSSSLLEHRKGYLLCIPLQLSPIVFFKRPFSELRWLLRKQHQRFSKSSDIFFLIFSNIPDILCFWHLACKNPAVFKGILGVKTLGSPTNPGQTENWPWTWLCVWAFCRIIASVKCVFLHSFQVQLLAEVFCTIVSFILIN